MPHANIDCLGQGHILCESNEARPAAARYGLTVLTEFLPPNVSSAVSEFSGSCFQSPSTINLYWYFPGFSGTEAIHTPEEFFSIGLAVAFHSLKSPAT